MHLGKENQMRKILLGLVAALALSSFALPAMAQAGDTGAPAKKEKKAKKHKKAKGEGDTMAPAAEPKK
jgi:hypothetical protein